VVVGFHTDVTVVDAEIDDHQTVERVAPQRAKDTRCGRSALRSRSLHLDCMSPAREGNLVVVGFHTDDGPRRRLDAGGLPTLSERAYDHRAFVVDVEIDDHPGRSPLPPAPKP